MLVPRRSASNARRKALVATLVLLSLVTHTASAGSLPNPAAVLGGVAVAGAIAWALLDKRRSFLWLAAVMFGGQLLMHTVVVALGHHGVSYLPDFQMMLGHLLAAAVAAALFANGEQLAARWARSAARILGVLPPPTIVVDPLGRCMHVYDFARTRLESVDIGIHPRRGPPFAVGAPAFT